MTLRWEHGTVPPLILDHWAGCPNCDHVVECFMGPPDAVHLDRPPHLAFGRWLLAGDRLPAGLGFTLTNDAGELVYGAWLPQREALSLRDQLLDWWPLDRYPKGASNS